MRLTAEEIEQAILHSDRDVREAAVYYFAGSCSPDPTIMPLAIQAFERFGLEAFEIYSFLEGLVQTDETVAWLIREIRRIGSRTGEREVRYRDALIDGLRRANPAVLKRHEPAIQATQELDDDSKEAIDERIFINSFTPEALWQELTEFCDEQEAPEETSDEDYEYVCSVVEALGRYPDQFADQVLAILIGEPGEWLEGMAVRLAGEMKLEAAVPCLLDRFDHIGDWIYEETHQALAKIGSDAIVDEIRNQYATADEDFRMAAASTLEDIHTDLSVETCLELLDQEDDDELRGSLLQSVLMNFSSEGIEPARRHVLNAPKTPESLEVRYALLVACKLMGKTFPEFDTWLEDSKSDMEFRRQWYEEHPLYLSDDEDEFEDDDLVVEEIELLEDVEDDESAITIVNRGERVGRNDPCPCGSGKKFKKCCYGKQAREKSDQGHSTGMSDTRPSKSSVTFPIGTVALYGPDDRVTTKIVAAVIKREGADPILERWMGSNIKDSPKVKRGIKDIFDGHRVKSVAMSDGNIGCPHEEGQDFPRGEDCPFCPFWAGKQGSGRNVQ